MKEHSVEFNQAWEELNSLPKWKKKPETARAKALERLGRFDEEFSIMLMETAIMGNYQGVVFPDTEEKYKRWQRSKQNESRISNNYKASILNRILGAECGPVVQQG